MKKNHSLVVVKDGNPARLAISTTTHGNGERLRYLRRNMENLDQSTFKDWLQIIVVDHSPPDVLAQIEQAVRETEYPEKRMILLMTGLDMPVGFWGKYGHDEALFLAIEKEMPYIAFHCDDNCILPEHFGNLIATIDAEPDIDIAWSSCSVLAPNGQIQCRLNKWQCGQVDLGQVVYRIDGTFKRHGVFLCDFRDDYFFDWRMMSFFKENQCYIRQLHKSTYLFSRDWKEAKLPDYLVSNSPKTESQPSCRQSP